MVTIKEMIRQANADVYREASLTFEIRSELNTL